MKEKQEEEIKQHKERLTSMESEKHKGAGLVSLVQEHKVKTLTSQLEVREAQLNHILSTCHADPNEASESCKKLEVTSTIIYFL
jgi:Growth-arrest specific micro-tubule binding